MSEPTWLGERKARPQSRNARGGFVTTIHKILWSRSGMAPSVDVPYNLLRRCGYAPYPAHLFLVVTEPFPSGVDYLRLVTSKRSMVHLRREQKLPPAHLFTQQAREG
jgi:hypothetical protein